MIITSPIIGIQVIWAALIAFIFLKEKINSRIIFGMLKSIIGVVVLTLTKNGLNVTVQGWQWTIMFVSLTSRLLLLFLVFYLQNNVSYYSTIFFITICKFLLAGILGASAIICVTTAMSLTEVTSVTTINSSQTALARIIAFFLLGEKMSLGMFAGIMLIMLGVIFVQLKNIGSCLRMIA